MEQKALCQQMKKLLQNPKIRAVFKRLKDK